MGEIMTNANVGGEIPDRNGFIAGYSITVHNELAANTGMSFRFYRDGVATRYACTITSADNDGHGAVRARPLNTNPGIYTTDPENDIVPFKAGERLAWRAEAPTLDGISVSTDMNKFKTSFFYTFEKMNSEAAQSMSGSSSGGAPGGEGAGDGGLGNGDGDGGDIVA